jgi:hypothetical protein
MYRQILTEGPMSEKGGAGLGLIEMARKSGEPIQYHFEDNGDTSEFAMQLNKSLTKDVAIATDINEGVELYKQFKAKGVLLFFKGDFDRETTHNIVQMLSKNTEHNKSLKKLIFHVGVELLQNVTRHSLSINDKKNGTFSIAHVNGKITITTSNYVSESSKRKLENHILKIQSKTKAELRELYKNALTSVVLDNDSNQGIGLIDIARYGANMTCCFQDTSSGIQAEITATLEE